MNVFKQRSLDEQYESLIQQHYLHTKYEGYGYVKKNYLEKINLQLSKSIWNDIIRNQQAREERFLIKIGIKGKTSKEKMNLLNEWINNNELLRQTIEVQNNFLDETIQEAIDKAMIFQGDETVSDKEFSEMISLFTKTIVNTKQQSLNSTINNFNQALGKDFKVFESKVDEILQKNLKECNFNKEEVTNKILQSQDIQNLKGAILKNNVERTINQFIIELLKNKNMTATERTAYKRMPQTYDTKIMVDVELANKFLTMEKKNLNVPLRWGGKTDTIDNFVRNMKRFPRLIQGTEKYYENRDSLIYMMINDLLFGKGLYDKNPTVKSLIKMVRQSILFMAIDQVDKETDSDFLFIGNKLVPLSYIMERIRDYDNFNPILTVNDNGLKPYDKNIITQKLATPKDDGYYTGALEIGHKNGELFWKSIRLKELKLQLKLQM